MDPLRKSSAGEDLGGHIIGHTGSGKPVYEDGDGKSWAGGQKGFKEVHTDWTAQDHSDARFVHHAVADAAEAGSLAQEHHLDRAALHSASGGSKPVDHAALYNGVLQHAHGRGIIAENGHTGPQYEAASRAFKHADAVHAAAKLHGAISGDSGHAGAAKRYTEKGKAAATALQAEKEKTMKSIPIGLAGWLQKADAEHVSNPQPVGHDPAQVPDPIIMPIGILEDEDLGGGSAAGSPQMTLLQPAWQDDGAQWAIRDLQEAAEESEEHVEKSTEGEGSRGGHIIGHTSGGKPIYAVEKIKTGMLHRVTAEGVKAAHGHFSTSDHAEAAVKLSMGGKHDQSSGHVAAAGGTEAVASHASSKARQAGIQAKSLDTTAAHAKAKDAHMEAVHAHKLAYGAGENADHRHTKQLEYHLAQADHHGGQEAVSQYRKDKLLAGKTEKSMAKDLSGWLQKAGIASIPEGISDVSGGEDPEDSLVEGSPSITPGKANGGRFGEDQGKGSSARSGEKKDGIPGQEQVNSGSTSKLSEDDPDLGDIGEDEEPGVVSKKLPLPPESPELKKALESMEKGGFRDVAAEVEGNRRAALRRRAIEGGTNDLHGVGMGVPFQAPKAPDAPQVITKSINPYLTTSNQADLEVTAMLKAEESGYYGGAPTMPAAGMLRKSCCPACSAPQPAWLTRCGACGKDMAAPQAVAKSMRPAGRLTLRTVADLRLPNGTTTPKS